MKRKTWRAWTRKEEARLADLRARGRTAAQIADALDDAGCRDDVILSHLRSPGPHARGCWVLDLLLGKS